METIMNRLYRCEEFQVPRLPNDCQASPEEETSEPWSIGFGLGMAVIISYCVGLYVLAGIGVFTLFDWLW